MKKFLKLCLAVVLSLFFAFIITFSVSVVRMQERFENELYGNVIRLHILANSDSDLDQQAKIEIKNRVVDHISQLTCEARSADDAADIIMSNQDKINDYVQMAAQELGYDYAVSTDFSDEKYPVRYYNGFAFPAGTYKSLRINLGNGTGKNWWCVLYPSICVAPVDKVEELLQKNGVSDETVKYICEDEKYILRFRFLELFGL